MSTEKVILFWLAIALIAAFGTGLLAWITKPRSSDTLKDHYDDLSSPRSPSQHFAAPRSAPLRDASQLNATEE